MRKHLNKKVEKLLSSLDLKTVSTRTMEKTGWDEEKIKEAEKEYRRFLYLVKIHPGESMVPTEDVDEFWHQHILDTKKYLEDCQTIFGFFLHHNPHLVKGSEELNKLFERTNELYKTSFLNELRSVAVCAGDGASCAGRCYSPVKIDYCGDL